MNSEAVFPSIGIETCTFEDILPVWEKHLWPGRLSPIKTHSSMSFNGGNDMSIYDNEVYFYKAVADGKVLGVNSVFRTGTGEFRSRGLFVFPEHRGRGTGEFLLREAVRFAAKEDARTLWSIARVSALATYLRVGFRESHPAEGAAMEFGPNVYVVHDLK